MGEKSVSFLEVLREFPSEEVEKRNLLILYTKLHKFLVHPELFLWRDRTSEEPSKASEKWIKTQGNLSPKFILGLSCTRQIKEGREDFEN